jgi:hypothetical protein
MPGWTTWAILPTVGGLVWLLLNQLETAVRTSSILRIYFVLSLFLDLLFCFATWIGDRADLQQTERRWRPIRLGLEILVGRLGITFTLILITLRWGIALWLWPDAPRFTLVLVSIYFGALSLILLGLLVLTAFNLPLSFGNRSRTWPVYLAVTSFLAWSAVSYTRLLLGGGATSLAEWKIAGILVALGQLLLLLTSVVKGPILLEPLVALRRDIVFGRIDLDRAVRQLDIIVAGMRVSDALQQEVEKFLMLLREHDRELRAMMGEIEAMRVALSPPQSKEAPALTVDDVKKWYKAHELSQRTRVEKISAEVKRYGLRTTWLLGRDPIAKAAWTDIQARISAEVESVGKQQKEAGKSVDALLTEVLSRRASTPAPSVG